MNAERDVERDDYTWADLITDLACCTRLTMQEANDLTWEIRDIVHPYDVVNPLIHLFDPDPQRAAQSLAALLLTVREDSRGG